MVDAFTTASSRSLLGESRFDLAFDSHYSHIVQYFNRRLRGRFDAEELALATFEFAWRRIGEMPEEPNTRAWLHQIARRTMSNHWRAVDRERHLLMKLSSMAVTAQKDEVPSVELDDALAVALCALKPRERQAFRLIYWDELSHVEAAAAIGCSVNALNMMLFRSRRRLLAAVNGAVEA